VISRRSPVALIIASSRCWEKVKYFIFIIFYLEHKWTRLMLCPLRNTFRKTHESSRKPIKTTSLKPGDKIITSHDQPSVASDLDHYCQFKMPGKCKFLNKWLEQPQYHAWLRNSPDIHKAHCKIPYNF
jgi:hypothetical protein